jgi:putative membrane protein
MDVATRLAFERTRLAYERTMMAWVRTATSLITVGFTIYKFFQLERGYLGQGGGHLIGARGFSLLLVGIGLGSLVLATIEHRQNALALRAECPDLPRSMAAMVAFLVGVVGILALIAMIVQA